MKTNQNAPPGKGFSGFLLFIPALFSFLSASCAVPPPGEETLLLYARSLDVYREGGFVRAAEMLAEEKKFIPALVLRGKAEYLSGNFSAAEKSLARALRMNPGNTEAALFLARLFREAGKKEAAQKLADKILEDNPQEIRTLRFAAELAREKGVPGEAVSAALLDRAAEASAESAMVFLDRARARWTGGNRDGALEDLSRARALLPDDSPVTKAVEKLKAIIGLVQ